MELSFFAAPARRAVDGRDVEWFDPRTTAGDRGIADACHAGPPTGLLVRAMERALPDFRLVRITVDLAKPIPMAGFSIDVEVARRGRTAAGTRAAIIDGEGRERVSATGLHVAAAEQPVFGETLDNSDIVTPKLAIRRARALSDRRRTASRSPRVQW